MKSKLIITEFNGKEDSTYSYRLKECGNKFYKSIASLYTTSFGGWWKGNVELARIKNHGNGYTIKVLDGPVSKFKVKTIELDYAQAEQLLILLLQDRKETGSMKYREVKDGNY